MHQMQTQYQSYFQQCVQQQQTPSPTPGQEQLQALLQQQQPGGPLLPQGGSPAAGQPASAALPDADPSEEP